jgi:zona occludens toxin
MFKLVTGLPGAGKTSNELWKFLNAPEYANRPKYCTPVNGFEPDKHGVKPIDHISCWQELPEGSVIFCDEVQDYIGTDLGKIEPDWVKQLARHRHFGYDFICTTQSPMYLHSFVRKLAQPHIHYSKPYGMKGFEYQWETVQNDPTTKSAKAIGQRKMVSPNPGVFKVYTSTVLDTHKARPPYKILITLGLFVLLAISLSIFSFTRVKHIGEPDHSAQTDTTTTSHTVTVTKPFPSSTVTTQQTNDTPAKTTWTEDNIKPRIPGLAYTAPIYDQLTTPTDFPRVAGCITSKDPDRCGCYTQQGTPLDVPRSACEVFVKVGNFDPWLTGRRQQQQQLAQSKQQSQAVQTDKASKTLAAVLIDSRADQRAQSQGAEARGFATSTADYPQRVATVNGSKLAQLDQ